MTGPVSCEVALAYVASHHVMTIASVGDEGPAAAAVFYACIGVDLCFLSAPTTQHSRNLARRPPVAITIQDQDTDWRRIRGIQIAGTGEQLDGEEAARARDAFRARFPAILGPAILTDDIVRALAGIQWYRIRVDRVRLIDNAQGLGHATEWSRAELLACRAGTDRAS